LVARREPAERRVAVGDLNPGAQASCLLVQDDLERSEDQMVFGPWSLVF
jgi:hypothetical protein